MAGFPRLFRRATRHRLHSQQRVLHSTQITAIALPDLNQATERQHTHGLTHGVAADAQRLGQLRLGRQSLPYLPVALKDALTHALHGEFDQGTLGQRYAHHIQPIIR
ncbi:hypothetical protein D3C79_818930 [compost metagenome]